MIRWLIVFFTAMAFRRGLSEDEMRGALIKAFPWRNVVWRTEIIEDAQQRNRRKLIDA